MDFLKRKMSRIGFTRCYYKVVIKPRKLEMTFDTKGSCFVVLKRGKHKEKTEQHTPEMSGYGRQNATVTFNESEVLARISDFYKKGDVLQEKWGKFQIFF